MIYSMTGFGRGEYEAQDHKITVEMKSVNHRYCDVNVRLPRMFNFLENDIKARVKKQFSRGKIDVFINYEDHSAKAESIQLNEGLADAYMSQFSRIAERFGIENDIAVSHISRYPEVLVTQEAEEDEALLWEILSSALGLAMEKMTATRAREGEALKSDILGKLTIMTEALKEVEAQAPAVVTDYKAKLEARIEELLNGNTPVDPERLSVEVAIFADKCCIDEEIVRLRSHIEHMASTLKLSQPVGRKLDFLAQEMNREANTILSKANSIRISEHGLGLKTEIEKIREQIQNIE